MSGSGVRGFTIEDNQIYAYCLTEGYNAYKGKGLVCDSGRIDYLVQLLT